MVGVWEFVVLSMLTVCCTLEEVRRAQNIRIREGNICTTPYVSKGKCMNVALCDQAFIHAIPYEGQPSDCQQNAFYRVACCQSFLDFCENTKNFQILHGNVTEPGMFPFIARLGKNSDEEQIVWGCGASIISQRFLLTAAHCRGMEITGLGCAESVQCDQQKAIKKFIPHPQYKYNLKYHDMALVELDQNINFNKYVLPICPYTNSEDLPETENLVIAGWGATNRHGQSQLLMYATVRTVRQDDCKANYTALLKANPYKSLKQGISNEMYCARGSLVQSAFEYVDACNGDSGGPLVYSKKFLIGVTSVGYHCGTTLPGIYSRVASYFDWIKETINASELQNQNNK